MKGSQGQNGKPMSQQKQRGQRPEDAAEPSRNFSDGQDKSDCTPVTTPPQISASSPCKRFFLTRQDLCDRLPQKTLFSAPQGKEAGTRLPTIPAPPRGISHCSPSPLTRISMVLLDSKGGWKCEEPVSHLVSMTALGIPSGPCM
jgi:hypothetical protein